MDRMWMPSSRSKLILMQFKRLLHFYDTVSVSNNRSPLRQIWGHITILNSASNFFFFGYDQGEIFKTILVKSHKLNSSNQWFCLLSCLTLIAALSSMASWSAFLRAFSFSILSSTTTCSYSLYWKIKICSMKDRFLINREMDNTREREGGEWWIFFYSVKLSNLWGQQTGAYKFGEFLQLVQVLGFGGFQDIQFMLFGLYILLILLHPEIHLLLQLLSKVI